ncbi:carbohydrate kinase family protein [Mucilaginibacter pedocola]|uniref:Carbohydrate kinase PfkB domain-containing protein n=1 Tax=Mucilaginibacter pedocola TaxID=1792845 RepID=A0A1S9PJM8_9SPHI|nr:hypothetical protein [Mucilaginibacter pedocola]OOQ61146.1 hypothetical protein BC343_22145 [Mucilaginibacter pedocola]
MKEKLLHIQQRLQSATEVLATKKVVAGFDGFVDSIVKVVNTKTEGGATQFFETIKQFGNYISAKSGSGFSLESEELLLKLGGNMPIMANAMAQAGVTINCVGAFGIPSPHTAFAGMHANCALHSYTNPGFTTAMEFTDGKIMLAQMTDLNHADWDTIKTTVGLSKLREIFADTDLVCLVNWSEPDHSNDMWQGLIEDVLTGSPSDNRNFFIDLSDCSKRSAQSIAFALSLIKQFGKHGRVTLSLNRNEASILYRTIAAENVPDNLQAVGDKLYPLLHVATLIIHTSKASLAWDAEGTYKDIPVFIPNPTISTGAGDNFNAGYCIGQLLGLDAGASLVLANATSNCYITSGESPSLTVLDNYISQLISASL